MPCGVRSIHAESAPASEHLLPEILAELEAILQVVWRVMDHRLQLAADALEPLLVLR